MELFYFFPWGKTGCGGREENLGERGGLRAYFIFSSPVASEAALKTPTVLKTERERELTII